MTTSKRHITPEMKNKAVFDGLVYPDGIAAFCRKLGIRDTMFYNWKNHLLSKGQMVFRQSKKETAVEQRLRNELSKKDSIISALVEENIELKKKFGSLPN